MLGFNAMGALGLKGITAVVCVGTVDKAVVMLQPCTDLPSLVASAAGASKATLAAVVGLVLGGGLVAWELACARDAAPIDSSVLWVFWVCGVIAAMWWASRAVRPRRRGTEHAARGVRRDELQRGRACECRVQLSMFRDAVDRGMQRGA